MTDRDPRHEPAPEFQAALKRELRRAYRAERQFGAVHTRRARRIGMVIGMVAGAVLTLTIGLVLGAATGYASAEGVGARQRENAAVISAASATKRQFVGARLSMARASYDSVQRDFAVGKATKAQADRAKGDLDSAQADAARMEVELGGNAAAAGDEEGGNTLSRIGTPVRNALAALTCGTGGTNGSTRANGGGGGGASGTANQGSAAQQGIPVVGVTAPSAKTTTPLGAVLGVRELSGGRLLVNDAGRRQMKVFDASLGAATIALDSAPGASTSYGPGPATIVPYLGDSTVVTQLQSRSTLLLDAKGQVARALAMPTYDDGLTPFPVPFGNPMAMDDKGRLLANGPTRIGAGGKVADSTPIVRADLESRRVEVVGAVHHPGSTLRSDAPQDGKRVVTMIIQPAPTEDAWSVLSDGTIAFVRGQDYHVDWVHPDGTKSATTKLPFDWKRLTDDDKQKLVDSARVVWDSLMAIRNARANPPAPRGEPPTVDGQQVQRRSSGGAAGPGQEGSIQRTEFVPLSEIPDYYPAIRQRSAIPDLDGNLWILPTTSAQSQHGELVYDVVNPKRGLYERVRLPLGRSIAGFGRGGVVYLQAGDRSKGFYLERVKVESVK